MQINNRNLSKIFIQNVTLLDCALFIPNKGPKGKSWYVDIIWEGEKDETGVLFDFSLAKKSAKSTIDHEFDHKLLVKASQIRFQSNSQIIIIGNFKSDKKETFFAINTYNNSIKKVARETIKALENDDVTELEKEIANAILRNSPNNVKNVTVTLREDDNKKKSNYFSYTHSLCHHYGNCQRFHGHSNIIEVFHKGKIDPIKSTKAAKKLNNSYIISRNYLANNWDSRLIKELIEHCPEIADSKDELIAAQYKGTQGEVAVIMPKANTLLMSCESTVENLAEYIRNQFGDDTEIEVRAYEGLAKGSICT
ncbi:6-carboxytetrahydropterin synthase [Fluviispira multicolorata]|uniref:6-carboxy-5,6,7,8-tetrahydropterin synthase n=1 Tax=Fluviispira multicolorata TaxID=2654512 RepID=A0A833JBA0_9BACT|nr:6-carboxytetrahydropterin synthase [Fluviispira multicolorata]KAB8027775.1 hypothetical protein GCL57_14305 [Fluviispira multicolorata]